MSVAVKICGLTDAHAVQAVIAGGAAYAGFMCHAPSPRFVVPGQAQALVALLPEFVRAVGIFVNPRDEEIAAFVNMVPVTMLQLHGDETPRRVAEVRNLFGLPVIKAVGVDSVADSVRATTYGDAADMLLLDAKAPKGSTLPGGNAAVFDWNILRHAPLTLPWMLAGGLTAANLSEAIKVSGAKICDVSSGVEDAPGHKNPQKIKDFLACAKGLHIL